MQTAKWEKVLSSRPKLTLIDGGKEEKPFVSLPNLAKVHPRVMASAPHNPVMAKPITEALKVEGDEPAILVDCTLGAGGHTNQFFLNSGKNTHVIGFDRDPSALELASNRLVTFKDRLHLIGAPFDEFTDNVKDIMDRVGAPLLGVLWDLGVSSMQLDTPGRGFSFKSMGPVDMRMDPTSGLSASDYINQVDEIELKRVISMYGEEPAAGAIAKAIVSARPFNSTLVLAETIAQAMPAKFVRALHKRKVHPATRTFQALRIVVNGELDRFKASLPQALDLLMPVSADSDSRGGRMAILSYHSLEDRIAKKFIAQEVDPCVCPPGLPVCGCGLEPTLRPITKGAQEASEEEVQENPRSRSAKLRIAERIGPDHG